ncbi:hypothetical protein OIU34_19475 [Pararhizobium sp. BT-229]|uniref:hypothetical protein n=1 Tax=Pararhizobium sp. BT-229 TaxID=2986923 RepID=UPI0021F7767B|nr:hypothetical protein [Pararhizobium sp. BT-229]MCV9964065.1 hypothetical protein [Pararhizobium sp. BT-229]
MTAQENSHAPWPFERSIVRAVCAVAFVAVAASLYGKAFPEPTTVDVRALAATHGEASDTCRPLQVPRYTFDLKGDKSGARLVTAWVSHQDCVDTAVTAEHVRSLIAAKMTADGIGVYGMTIEFYDVDRPFGPWLSKYHYAPRSELGV